MSSQEINLSNSEIINLLSESTTPKVSIIIPTHLLSSERIFDIIALNKALSSAKVLLAKKHYKNKSDSNAVIQNIEEIAQQIDYTKCEKGIGIFASPTTAKLIYFPFPVVEKIKVGDAFETRDLLYFLDNIIEYYVLSLSKDKIQLFKGKGEELLELVNEDFPVFSHESYENLEPIQGASYFNSLHDYVNDKPVIHAIQQDVYLRKADQALNKYIFKNTPLVVSGGRKEIADYLLNGEHKEQVVGKLAGNYNFNGDLQLSTLAWIQIRHHIKNKNEILLSFLHELDTNDMIAIGVEEVWKAAKVGNGLKLIVEKDFECTTYAGANEFEVKLKKKFTFKKQTQIADTVERIIRTVKGKKGKVVFVNNGEMKNFNHIALQLRYNKHQWH